jgi:hypothetical protein
LPSEGVFQFDGGDGSTVDAEENIGDTCGFNFDFASDGEAIFFIKCQGFRVHTCVGLEVSNSQGFTIAFEAISQNIKHSSAFEFFGEAIYNNFLSITGAGAG